jgi:hypothetical protein
MIDGEGVIPGVVDAGIGGGDEGGSADSSQNTNTDSAVSQDDGNIQSDADSGQQSNDGSDGQATPQKEDYTDPATGKIDARKVEASVRTELANIAKTKPEVAKTLRESYFKTRQFEAEFKTPAEAKTAKMTLETLGGAEGIEQLQSKVTDYDREIEQFANGDVGLIEDIHNGNPEGVLTMAGNTLDFLAERNPKGYSEVMTPQVVRFMKANGYYNGMQKLEALVKAGKGQESFDLIQEFKEHMAGMETTASQRAKTKEIDPDREKLNKEREEVKTEKEKIYSENINNHLTTLTNGPLAEVVDPMLKELGLEDEGKREFVNEIYKRTWAAMKADTAWQKLAQAKKSKGDAKAMAEFAAAKFNELAPEIARKYRNTMYPARGTKKAAAPANGKQQGPQAVPGKVYDRSAVDLDATPEMLIVTGKAYLRGTKQIVAYRSE